VAYTRPSSPRVDWRPRSRPWPGDAHASEVQVLVEARAGVLGLSIRDDGRGGADPSRGSGLIGLTDRVDALGGTIEVASPSGKGTTLLITLPIEES
jgi:signal transduction histidine kinase